MILVGRQIGDVTNSWEKSRKSDVRPARRDMDSVPPAFIPEQVKQTLLEQVGESGS